jgi:hypothetical protein
MTPLTDWLTPGEFVFAVVFFVPFATVMGLGCLYVFALIVERIIFDL